MTLRLQWDKLAGALLVVALHAAALWGLWSHRLLPTPADAATLFVNFIAPPSPPKVEQAPKREPPKPRPEETPRQLVAEAPVTSPTEAVAPPPLPAPVVTAPVEPKPTGPVTLGAELSVACPERTAPNYPVLSRRMGETGITVLRVELDELGHVSTARVATGSGFARLDDAALSAVKTWRCNPAQRNGQAVRAVALQPFKFVLQGN
ncbi:MAG: energy transducer TonB [Rhodocyclales bacterium]|nr:energy transducer TonB [Rhodocyclales bacterium]